MFKTNKNLVNTAKRNTDALLKATYQVSETAKTQTDSNRIKGDKMKKLLMETFKTGKDYQYSTITNNKPPDAILTGYGPRLIGKHFITITLLAYNQDRCCSFVLTEVTGKDYTFTCVYNDFTKEKPE